MILMSDDSKSFPDVAAKMSLALAEYRDSATKIPERWYPIFFQMSEAPYPVDSQIGGLVSAARENYVVPYEVLVSRHIEYWVWDVYIAEQGHRVDWGDQRDDNRFPYLINVPDDTFHPLFDGTLDQIKDSVREDGVITGATVELPTIPLNYGSGLLRRAPLVDGLWIDAEIVILAELGNDLQNKGFSTLPPIDRHLLAWLRIFPPGTDWSNPRLVEVEKIITLHEATRQKVCSFDGNDARKDIADRLFLDFRKYSAWREKHFQGQIHGAGGKIYDGVVVPFWSSRCYKEWEDEASENDDPKVTCNCPIATYHDQRVPIHKVRPENHQVFEQGLGSQLQERWKRFEDTFARALQEARNSIKPPRFEGDVLIWNNQRCDFSSAPDQQSFMSKLIDNIGKSVTLLDLYEAIHGITDSVEYDSNEKRNRESIRSLKRLVCKRLKKAGMQGIAAAIKWGKQKYTLMI